jgi:hypothetical protein
MIVDTLPHEADDHFHDECGVFGIFGRQDAAVVATLGLHALQHRGQEAAGIVSFATISPSPPSSRASRVRAPSATRAIQRPAAQDLEMCSRCSLSSPMADLPLRTMATLPTP